MSDVNINKPPNKNESGILTVLWRKILTENNLMPAIGMFINRYIKQYDSSLSKVSNVKKKNRSTLITNITAPEMSFKCFIDLVFNFLRARRLDISIKITHENGKTSTHFVSVDSSLTKDQPIIEEDVGEADDVSKT